MNLSDYIASVGTAKFAKQFKVSPRTAEAWRSGRRRPMPAKASEIVDVTPVTWEGIYRPGGEDRAPRGLRPVVRSR
jgi:hypothetical protein